MNVSDVESRRNRILESIIETYVATVVPVGSQLVARKLRSVLSPATIRSIMSDLEEAGLLEQPHTSAGRVPTERGYRFYVDSVMEAQELTPEQVRQIQDVITPSDAEIERLLERASEALAELTQQAAFVVAPTVLHSTVRQVELVPLGMHKLLCVLVADGDVFASHVVESADPITRDELLTLVRFINSEFVGHPFAAVLDMLERRLLAERDSFYFMVKRSLDILQHALATEPEDRLLLEGTSYIMAQPEFRRDPRKAHVLLQALESAEELAGSIREDLRRRGITVRIGREMPAEGLEACSYVAAPFALGGQVLGGIGVLGPTRMDYRRIIALVDGMAESVTGTLGRWVRDAG